jgi:hypothetical protein
LHSGSGKGIRSRLSENIALAFRVNLIFPVSKAIGFSARFLLQSPYDLCANKQAEEIIISLDLIGNDKQIRRESITL